MVNLSCSFVYLPGAGGREDELPVFRGGLGSEYSFDVIRYPGWQHFVHEDFTAEVLIADLVAQVLKLKPDGPIMIVGMSLGGHLAYAVSLCLEEMGREIAGFCAIDSFMVESASPSEGWQGRAFAQGIDILRRGRLAKFICFVRSKFWRALFRLAGERLTRELRAPAIARRLPRILAVDPIAEEELSMRLLLRAVIPWISSLDRAPVVLKAPTVFLRTAAVVRDDEAWRRRCPNIEFVAIPGRHATLLEPENIEALREAFRMATREWCGRASI